MIDDTLTRLGLTVVDDQVGDQADNLAGAMLEFTTEEIRETLVARIRAEARQLRARLLQGFDLIAEARAVGDTAKADKLQAHWATLQTEYNELKAAWATCPEDLARCPDCPLLGRGLTATGVICDLGC